MKRLLIALSLTTGPAMALEELRGERGELRGE